MRITNKMITNNASGNINGNKVLVDKTNTQMTTQKKIARPSENPVIAIRSLRLQTTLNKVNQYYEKNIPDAESWMDVTETALTNIKDLLKNMRTLCVNGSTGTLTEDDRSTILTQLKSLQSQVYAEGNADYAGRTVFTGYRTNKTLTFTNNDSKTNYNITEPSNSDKIYKKRFYTNEVEVPATATEMRAGVNKDTMDVGQSNYNVIRLSYDLDNLGDENAVPNPIPADQVNSFEYTFRRDDGTTKTYKMNLDVDANGDPNLTEFDDPDSADPSNPRKVSYAKLNAGVDGDGVAETPATLNEVLVFNDEADWAAWSKTQTDTNGAKHTTKYVPENSAVIIKSTGEMVLGDKAADVFLSHDASFNVNYNKTGFKSGELRPEYYFNCTQYTDETGAETNEEAGVKGTKFERFDANGKAVTYEIQYTVSQNQELTVNMEANEAFNHDIYQDMGDMIDIVNRAVAAHNKVDAIKGMMGMDEYQSETDQAQLNEWLKAAQKEADYADDNLQKRYGELLGNVDSYLEDITLAITKMGCRGDQLEITKTRMNNQQETVEELQSTNDDMDLSDIIIKYTAAYTAYQSSLTAAGKLGQQTLLNYI